ncbi:MAG TPA: hypothetical protein DD723_07090 [Candidatus Omnitrophica bacterium]|nr:MAG: hypothetical protein A2Z81_05870 [Omnitrophica WOR_2 bacterium GWA2_45_18]OGX19856.1 MAG: hypothetical protein A2Y04_05325 [Omnitrophica WOR_2 bacterium GWC2_45_7]HBR15290.1 hypothetical protein [Candidatus Omnitrophota bacterium]
MRTKNVVGVLIIVLIMGFMGPAVAQFRRDLGRMIGKVVLIDRERSQITVKEGAQERIFQVNPSQLAKVFEGVDVFVSFRLDSEDALYLKIIEPK